jgi:hypothetical protein
MNAKQKAVVAAAKAVGAPRVKANAAEINVFRERIWRLMLSPDAGAAAKLARLLGDFARTEQPAGEIAKSAQFMNDAVSLLRSGKTDNAVSTMRKAWQILTRLSSPLFNE